MDEALWQRIEPLLDRVLDADPAEREAILDRECAGEPELRAEVERFLDECLSADGFLDAETLDLAKDRALVHSFEESLLDRRFGAYRTVEVLGRGGMGTVLRAERADGHFEQRVAIKVVSPRRLDPAALERFRFERQILADLEHPSIAKLLDGGVSDGIPYLVMDLIEGSPLDAYVEAAGASIAERLRLLITVCEAIDHAHRHRVVHLDLKPSNLLVTPEGRPMVLDFGIAQILDRRSAAEGSSSSGRMTPHYAAPEQLRGEPVTNSCDVYSLGVVLFRLLTGGLPFERRDGESVEQLVRRVSETPAPRPGSRATLPSARELDAVAAKALRKDPRQRYASAADLGEDLRRILEHRPIRALAAGPVYRWRKHVQRNPWAWMVACVLLVVSAVLVTGRQLDRRAAEKRLEIAQTFAREAESIDGFLRYAYALPAHDVRREKALSEERMDRLRLQVDALGEIAEGPGHLALGRALLSLRRPREAVDHLRRAWDAGMRSPTTAFAWGRALGDVYRRERTAALEIRDPALRSVEIERLGEAYRKPALDLLGRVDEISEIASPSIVEAMIALLEERPEEALVAAERAADEAPWLPDGLRLQGEAHSQIAQEHVAQSRWQEATAAADRAVDALKRAARLAPSDTLVADTLCDAHMTRTAPQRLRRAPQDSSAGLDACRRAAELDPDLVHSLLQLARLHVYAMQDPSASLDGRLASLQEGLARADDALEAAPGDPEALTLLGSAYLTRAVFLSRARGEDPRPDLETAAEHLKRATEASPGLVVAHVNLGTATAILAEERLARGGDPEPAFETAMIHLQEALDRSPKHGVILANLGNLTYNRAVYRHQRGEDPSDLLRRALDVCERSLEVNPELIQAYNLRAAVLETSARIALAKNEPAEELLDGAQRALDRAREINPEFLLPWVNEGALLVSRARAALRRGEDPEPWIEASLASLERASELSRDPHEVLSANLAETLLLRGRLRLLHGQSPRAEDLARVDELVREGLETTPRSSLLKLHGAWAEVLRVRADDPRREERLDRAERLLERLLADRPAFADALLLAAEIELRRVAIDGRTAEHASAARRRLDALASTDGLDAAEPARLRALADRLDGTATEKELPEPSDPLRAAELAEIDVIRPAPGAGGSAP